MSQDRFVRRYQPRWQATEKMMVEAERRRGERASLPDRYRELCAHLALARHRRYGVELIDTLNALALRGHQQLYGGRRPGGRLRQLFGVDFPKAVRANSGLMLASFLLFFGPLFVMATLVYRDQSLIYSLMDPASVAQFEEMYDPKARALMESRGDGGDIAMFGFYIRNNIGIAFRTFAGGLIFGVGAIFFLVFNGLYIGAVAGYLTAQGFGETFHPFAIGHGAFELTAIAVAGAAGLKLGLALVSPGRYRRGTALAMAAKEALPLIYGFAGMLAVAAVLEAFWSSSEIIPSQVKYIVGAVLWATVFLYFVFAGRRRAA